MVNPTPSSFYADGEQYDEATVVPNDYTPANIPSQAPSSLYPQGTAYDALANVEDVVAEINSLLADTQAAAAEGATSATASQASADASHTSEINSAASAAASSSSASAAAASATTSQNNATSSGTSATNAANSASAAASSATSAAGSATTATTQAGIATTQAGTATTEAGIATTQAGNAATSATAAANSATSASTSAGNASTSATAAAGSASAANTSKINAANSESNANTYAANALASQTAAANSANSASTSATNAGTSATNAASSASTASTAATNAQNAYNSFRGIYYGSASSDPTLDPNGAAPGAGDFYFNTTTQKFRAYSGTAWADMVAGGQQKRFIFTATAAQTTFTGADTFSQTLAYTAGSVEVIVNGLWLPYSEYTATNGSSVVLNSGSAAGDVVYVFALSNFSIADTLQKSVNGADILSPSTFRANLGLNQYATAALGQLPGAGTTTVPAAGMIGEQIANNSSVTLSSGSQAVAASIVLTPGVWDIDGFCTFGGPGATLSNNWSISISPNAASTTGQIFGFAERRYGGTLTADCSPGFTAPRRRVTVSSTQTWYLNAQASISGSGYSASGQIVATRIS